MSAITTMLEAALGPWTELTHAHELVRSSGHCGSLEPRWWVVDIGVRARVLDTSGGAVARPAISEFNAAPFCTRAPLHLLLEVGLLDSASGSSRTYLLDATSLRTYVLASSITIKALGPSSLCDYPRGGDMSLVGPRTLHCQVSAGLWPLDTEHQRVGVPGPLVHGNSCSLRVRVAADDDQRAVWIPTGARTLTIFDASGSPWTWQFGQGAVERCGLIPATDGESSVTVPVPNFTHVAPAEAMARDRDVLLVFGVEL